VNVITSEAEATFDVRPMPDEDILRVFEDLKRLIDDLAVSPSRPTAAVGMRRRSIPECIVRSNMSAQRCIHLGQRAPELHMLPIIGRLSITSSRHW